MTITEQLVQDACGLLTTQPEVSDHLGIYHMFNDGGVECETGEFLFGLARMTKPVYVVETGTHLGVGAAYLGSALRANGFGKLHTIEFLRPNWERAMDLIDNLGLLDYVSCHLMDAAQFEPTDAIDILFLDTEPQTRFAELLKFFSDVRPGGYILIHDLHEHMHQIPNDEHGFAWPYGPIPQELHQYVMTNQLRPFHFETPRGLTGFYKTAPGAHRW